MGSDMDGDDAGDDFGGDDMGGDDMEDEGMGMMEAAAGSGSGKSGSGKAGSGKSGSGKSGSGKSGSGNPFAKKGSGSGKMESRSQAEIMKEYVDKVKDFYKSDEQSHPSGHMAGTGEKSEKQGETNTKSVSLEKGPDFGGESTNIVPGGAESNPDGQKPNGKAGGFLKAPQEIDVAKRNVNKPGGNKGAEDWYNTKAKAKSAEGSTTDGSVPVAKKSVLVQNSGKK
jgi:hypothetical protein